MFHKQHLCLHFFLSNKERPPHNTSSESPISPKQLHPVEDSSKGSLKMVEMSQMTKNLSRKNSKGFVVKMRFLHKRSQAEKANSIFWYRYFKWLLWFSLSSYFFVSFLITRSSNPIKPTSFSLPKHSFSRALIESQHPITHPGVYCIYK